ncbi:unnamed protein product [Mortierella alpina]
MSMPSPVIKRANLGIATNFSSSHVSKEAAAMILLDDNSSIDLVAEEASVRFVSRSIDYNYKVLHKATASWIKSFAVQVDLPQSYNFTDASWITLDGKRYDLINLHFHSPAKHRVNNQYYDAGLHMVHQTSDGAVA